MDDRSVRPATADDERILDGLRRHAADAGVPAVVEAPGAECRCYVLVAAGRPIGFCEIDRAPALPWAPSGAAAIRTFFVVPEHAHSGYGAYLALSVIRLEPSVRAWVGVAAAENEAIRGFWLFLAQMLGGEGWRLRSLVVDEQVRFIAVR